MANITPIDKMNEAISKILKEYGEQIDMNMNVVVPKVCQKGAKALRDESGNKFDGKEYKKSWTYKVLRNRLYAEGVIYSKTPGLPHLLEHGHVIKAGGRVAGRAEAHPHIAPVAEKLITEFEKEVKRYL